MKEWLHITYYSNYQDSLNLRLSRPCYWNIGHMGVKYEGESVGRDQRDVLRKLKSFIDINLIKRSREFLSEKYSLYFPSLILFVFSLSSWVWRMLRSAAWSSWPPCRPHNMVPTWPGMSQTVMTATRSYLRYSTSINTQSSLEIYLVPDGSLAGLNLHQLLQERAIGIFDKEY